MASGDMMMASPRQIFRPKAESNSSRTVPDNAGKAAPLILDMGEESREQGFKLNGCR